MSLVLVPQTHSLYLSGPQRMGVGGRGRGQEVNSGAILRLVACSLPLLTSCCGAGALTGHGPRVILYIPNCERRVGECIYWKYWVGEEQLCWFLGLGIDWTPKLGAGPNTMNAE